MKITPPASVTTAGSSQVEPIPQPAPVDCKQTADAAEKRHLAALQAVQTVSAQAAQIRNHVSDHLTDQLALCLAASLAAAWLQPPETTPGHNRNHNPINLPLEDRPQCNRSRPSAVPSPLPSDGRGEGQGEVRVPFTPNPPFPEADSAALLNRIKELSPLLLQLRRGDQYGEWLQIQRQWQALATLKHQDHLAAQKAKTEVVPRSLRDDGGFSQETLDKTIRALNLF
jgi:hypothetical protein